MLDYIPPTSFEELRDFHKLNCDINGEIWEDDIHYKGSRMSNEWKKYELSNYGRLRNIKTGKLKLFNYYKLKTYNSISSFEHFIQDHYKNKYKERICDLMSSFASPNYRPKDGNIFNLHSDNIICVEDSHYKGSDEYREEWIYINGEKTNYTIDTNGIIINQDRKKLESIYNENNNPHNQINLLHKGIRYTNSRAKWMAEAFIPNPHNLKYVKAMNLQTHGFSMIKDIYWTDK